MADVTQQQVVDYIKNISVMELSQLVKTLEAELGVSAAAAMPAGPAPSTTRSTVIVTPRHPRPEAALRPTAAWR